MKNIIQKLISQGILYNLSVLIFQSFITFYIIKYFQGVQGAIIGNIILYLAVACGYLVVARANHQRSISIRTWMFFSIVLCVLSTCMMQWKTMGLLLIGFAFLGFGKGVYFCCLYLYEFEYVPGEARTRYAAIQSEWKSASEIIIPLILGYLFSIIVNIQLVYLIVFISAGAMLVITAINIYSFPEFIIQPLEHSHYKSIFKKTSSVAILYMMLVGLNVLIPFIGTLLEVKILTKESRTGLFQGITKGVTLLILLLVLRYSHIINSTKYFMKISLILGLSLLILPRRSNWMILIIYVVIRSLLLSLFTIYEKPIGMEVMESMASEHHSMLPVIIIQVILQSGMRVIALIISLIIIQLIGIGSLTNGIILLTGIGFISVAGLVFFYISKKDHPYQTIIVPHA